MRAIPPAHAFDVLSETSGQQPCIATPNRVWSRREISDQAAALATHLRASGVTRGSRIGIINRNCPLHIVTTIAAARLGAIAVPINFRLCAAESAQILRDARCAVVIAGAGYAAALQEYAGELPPSKWIIDPCEHDEGTLLPPGIDPAPRNITPPVEVDGDELLLIQYTSGSTGRPKGVQITYRNLWASWDNLTDSLPLAMPDTTLTVSPFSHVGGLTALPLQALFSGGMIVMQQHFDPGLTLELIDTHRVTSMFAVPTIYETLAREPSFHTLGLESLRVALIGGSSPSPKLFQTYADRGIGMYHSWGMTETTGGGTSLPAELWASRPQSVGQALKHTEVRIIDPKTGELAATGQTGELQVRGPNVTPGYWGLMANEQYGFLPEGWLKTSDLAEIDPEGYVTLRGRLTDLIISGGENIYPVEIESAICRLPGVDQCAVVGVKDRCWGQTPVAIIKMLDGEKPYTLKQLRDELAGHLARYKMPRHLITTTELPLGATGKPDRRALTEQATRSYQRHCKENPPTPPSGR